MPTLQFSQKLFKHLRKVHAESKQSSAKVGNLTNNVARMKAVREMQGASPPPHNARDALMTQGGFYSTLYNAQLGA